MEKDLRRPVLTAARATRMIIDDQWPPLGLSLTYIKNEDIHLAIMTKKINGVVYSACDQMVDGKGPFEESVWVTLQKAFDSIEKKQLEV